MSSVLLPNGKQAFTDNNGRPLVGGKVYFYTVGTSTAKDTYQDYALTILNTNPVILDARGEASIYGVGNYRQVLRDAAGNLIWDQIVVNATTAIDQFLADINSTDPGKGLSLIAGAIKTLSSIAALRTQKAIRNGDSCFVLGYYQPYDLGGGLYRYDSTDTTSADNGGTIIVDQNGGRWKMVQQEVITTAQFGAKRDGTTDDTVALNNWFAYGMLRRPRMVISDGVHKLANAITWDFAPVKTYGITIEGNNPNSTILDFQGVPASQGIPFKWIGSSGAQLFYLQIGGFNIRTSYDGVGFLIGQNDLSDAFNSCKFEKITVNNGSQTTNCVATQINYVLQSEIDIVSNAGGSGRPSSPYSPGYGTACIMRQVAFSYIIGAFGNGNKGLYLTGGYNYGNTFFGLDIEEVNYALLIDSVNTTKNNFINGTILGLNLLNCTAGNSNVLDNVNLALYTGGTQNVSTVGLELRQPGIYAVSTPAFPASGTKVTNTTARKVYVTIVNGAAGAAMTSTTITHPDNSTEGVPFGSSWTGLMNVLLLPGESITINYTGTLAWLWRPA